MEGAKFCPLVKSDCRKEQCAWWDKYIEECAVLSMAFALWADVYEDEDEDEEDGEKEDKNSDRDEDEEKGTEDKEDKDFENGDVKEFKIKIRKLE